MKNFNQNYNQNMKLNFKYDFFYGPYQKSSTSASPYKGKRSPKSLLKDKVITPIKFPKIEGIDSSPVFLKKLKEEKFMKFDKEFMR